MALITNNTYKPPLWLCNAHLETIYPALFRKVSFNTIVNNITIHTPDNDYFELNYYDNNSDKTVIISHGLEGNNMRPYIIGMAKKLFENDWNVIAWNYRGCNGKINNSIKSYHSGFVEDLEEVIKFADTHQIKNISLIGFSLGGNLTLKYLGNQKNVHNKIRNAVTLSVPIDLHLGSLEISKSSNKLYEKRFLRSLKQKVKEKAKCFSEIDTKYLSRIHNLKAFDDHYTAPLHGFIDAIDYYRSCSALYVLDNVRIPTLIINALNDPFLPSSCYPFELLKKHSYAHLETPERGGHIGFCCQNGNEYYWSENRSMEFINSTL